MTKKRPCVTILGDATAAMIVYKITNTVTGRSYIGISTRSLKHRVDQHVCDALAFRSMAPLHVSMRNRGVDVFTAEVLERHENLDALYVAEIRLIAQYGTFDLERGYNQTTGGGGPMGFPRPLVADKNKAARRLTEDQVRAILLDPRMLHEIGADYGLSLNHVCNIMAGKRYGEWVAKAREEFGDLIDARMQVARHRSYPQRGGDNHPMRRNPELARQLSEKLKGRKAPETGEANKRRRSLTEDDIRLILTDPRTGLALAEFFGKSSKLIYAIRSGKKYADVVQRIRAEIESSETDQYQIAVGDDHG